MPANGGADTKRPNHRGQSDVDSHNRFEELLRPEDLPQLLQAVSWTSPTMDRQKQDPRSVLNRKSDTFKTLEVEIGCGNGHFMIEYCRLNPLSLFVGVEIKKKRCLKAQAKIDNQHIANARVVYGDAEETLRNLPDGSVDTFHLYYPDPWPKNKHRRRRFLRRENLEVLKQKLKIGGLIFFVTDFFDYYFHTKVLIVLQDGLELSSRVPSESIFQSMFSKRFLDTGKSLHRLAARKTGDPGTGSADDQMPDKQQEK
jgi:tRNA (guanine-N(7)-)-methyltransferase